MLFRTAAGKSAENQLCGPRVFSRGLRKSWKSRGNKSVHLFWFRGLFSSSPIGSAPPSSSFEAHHPLNTYPAHPQRLHAITLQAIAQPSSLSQGYQTCIWRTDGKRRARGERHCRRRRCTSYVVGAGARPTPTTTTCAVTWNVNSMLCRGERHHRCR